MEETGDRLKQFLDHKEHQQSEFHRKTGIDRAQIYRILKNEGEPGPQALVKITVSYPELNLSWLLTGEGEMLHEEFSETEKILLESFRETIPDKAQEWDFVMRVQWYHQEFEEYDKLMKNLKLEDPDIDSMKRRLIKWNLWEYQERRRWLNVRLNYSKEEEIGLLADTSDSQRIEGKLETLQKEINEWISLKSEKAWNFLEGENVKGKMVHRP